MKCHHCNSPSTVLCDYVIGVTSDSDVIELDTAEVITCSRPLCEECKTYVGWTSINGIDTIDLCRDHVDVDENVKPDTLKNLLIAKRRLQIRST